VFETYTLTPDIRVTAVLCDEVQVDGVFAKMIKCGHRLGEVLSAALALTPDGAATQPCIYYAANTTATHSNLGADPCFGTIRYHCA